MKKRQWYARLLLVIFLMMTAVSGLHHHEDVAAEDVACSECTHHIHHAGHISQQATNMHDCLLCQLCAMPYVAATLVAIRFFSNYKHIRRHGANAPFAAVTLFHSSPRAPPVVWFAHKRGVICLFSGNNRVLIWK